jgi:hypothetical protein
MDHYKIDGDFDVLQMLRDDSIIQKFNDSMIKMD